MCLGTQMGCSSMEQLLGQTRDHVPFGVPQSKRDLGALGSAQHGTMLGHGSVWLDWNTLPREVVESPLEHWKCARNVKMWH